MKRVVATPLGGGKTVEAPASAAALVRAMDFGDGLDPSRRARGVLVDAAWCYFSLLYAGELPGMGLPQLPARGELQASEVEDAVMGMLERYEARTEDDEPAEGGGEGPTR